MGFTHVFVDRPIFASVISIVITLIGAIAYIQLPVAQYPEVAPPTDPGHRLLPRRLGRGRGRDRGGPARAGDQRRREQLYMLSQATADGDLTITVTFGLGTDLDTAQVLVQNRVTIAEPRLPEEVRARRRHGAQELARLDDGGSSQLAGRLARSALHLQLRDTAGPRRHLPHRRRGRGAPLRGPRVFDAHLARSRADR